MTTNHENKKNIQVRIKVNKIYIVQIIDKILDKFCVTNEKDEKSYFLLNRYPTKKQKIVSNVVNLLNQ